MKNAMQRMKRALSLIMVIAMVMTMLPTVAFAAETPETLYLKPNSNWTQDNARFAAYFFGNGEKWVSMTDSDGDGVYEVTVPSGYPSVIFVRMNPSTTANNWNNKWNQTSDLTVPTDGTNQYTVKAGTWDKGGGTWSTYTPEVNEEESTTYTVYLINSANWAEVYAYAWIEGGAGLIWPGDQMTKTGDTVNGFDIYSITFETQYENIIFNNNNKGLQTPDLTLTVGQYYDLKSGAWYASLADVPVADPLATDAYLVGSFNGWSASEFKLPEAGATAGTVSLELEANTTYEFKVIISGTWTSCSTPITGDAEGLTFSSSVNDNCQLITTEAGTYVFAWDTATDALTVQYPQTVVEPTTYSVTFNGTNVSSDGADTVREGEIYTATLTADEGYSLPETVTVTGGTAEYDQATGALTITKITGNVVITAVGVENSAEPETITVYFRNDWLWPEVYVHYWDDPSGQGTEWPGVQMTLVENDIYTAEIPAWATGLLFNGLENGNPSNRQQTPNVTGFADGDAYYIHWDGEDKVSKFDYTPGGNEGGEEEPVETVNYKVTFHFANNLGWGAVNLYTWNTQGTLTGSWPGTGVSQGSDGFYTATVEYEAPASQSLSFIFNNGGDSGKTVDLSLPFNAFTETEGVYTAEKWVVLTNADSEGKYDADIRDNGNGIAISPIINGQSVTFQYSAPDAAAVYVAGDFNGWNTTANALTKDDYGVWSVTIENLTPGIHEYKFVVDGEWVADPCNSWIQNDNSAFIVMNPNAEDTNVVKVIVTYTRGDGNYENWNIAAWGAPDLKEQYDFTVAEGVATTTITLNGRASQTLGFKVRESIGSNKWAQQSDEIRVDLGDIVSGTIYVDIADGFSHTQRWGEDVVCANKIKDIQLDYDKNTITVTTVKAVNDAQTAFLLYKDGEKADIIESVTVSGTAYTLILTETLDLVNLYKYTVRFAEDSAEYADEDYQIGIDTVYASTKFDTEFTYEGELGAAWTETSTTFRVWAPTAETVSLNLYTSGTKGTNDCEQTVVMTKGEKGVWTVTVDGDLNGKYYTYSVKVNGETVEAVDPYARTTGVNGQRGMIIDLDSIVPADGWNEIAEKPASYTDAIIYELHVRDFSIDEDSGVTAPNRGKFLAFTETDSLAMQHLTGLGITHVHLLPIYDYASVDETECKDFNWGYDPQNYNAPEGSYSTDPYNGEVRVQEMKEMVDTLHENGIGVIMDVVYNHVYNAGTFCYNQIVPGYFSRSNSNASGCGNDTASEREMVRKYIVESVVYWADEYHLDGFRFDLVGLIDVETINQIVTEVHKIRPDILFYGEGWNMDGTNREPGTEMAKQGNADMTPGFGYFSDSIRNQIAGSNGSSLGFVSGGGMGNLAEYFLARPESWGKTWTKDPTQVVQYASCHDNYTLIDKLVLSTGARGLSDDIIRMNNLSAAIYMTAAGIPFIHAGEEFLREKLEEDGGRCENSYNASDYVNHIEWSNLEKADYAATVEYYKGLIAFRKEHAALRMASAELVADNIQAVKISKDVLAFLFDGNATDDDDILVIFNAGADALVTLPEGIWNVCVDGIAAGTATLYTAQTAVQVEGISAMILTRADEGKNEDKIIQADDNKYQYGTYEKTPDQNENTLKLYFSNNKYWDKVYAYAWGGTTSMTWPGNAMEYVQTNDYGEDIYSITVSADTTSIIFNNGSGEQTVDITELVDGRGYYCTDKGGGSSFANDGAYEGDSAYYLFGYINGVDYASEGNSAAMGKYLFVNGELTVCFDTDSYVGVKTTGDTWYMTNGWLGNVTCATLYNSSGLGEEANKLLIPGGVEVTFTLTENSDGTMTLSYQADRTGFEDKSGVQNGVTLHCWNWSFDEIAENMATIAEMGYTAIQTSPIQPLKEVTNGEENTVGSHWWVYYQPVDFVITTAEGNALGTKEDFVKMCEEAEKYGIQVIVDVVVNHLANETGNDLSSVIPDEIEKNTAYWHDITKNTVDYTNRYEVTQLCMADLPDLNTANKEIQTMVLKFLKECVDAGADGFRFDAAKHIETPEDDISFASDFWPTVIGGIQAYAGNDLYIYGETLDGTDGYAISDYTQYMSVTDNSWGNTLRGNVANGIAALTEGYDKAADASNLVIWAESHDTYATDNPNQSSAGVSEANINKTWALVAARANAMGLYFARPESNDQALGVASVTGWANPEVKAVNDFHNAFHGQKETIGNSGNISYVVRGDSGIVLVNVSGATAEVAISVPMADGTYTDRISGNTFTVADGKLTGTIGDTGIAVVRMSKAFDFYGTNVSLGNNLDMQFAFSMNAVEDWTGYYVEMVRTYSEDKNGTTAADDVVVIPYDKWDTSNSYFVVTYGGLAAKEMCDKVTVTVYDADGNAVSVAYTDSMRAYAMRRYNEAPTVFSDMLNYGAAAQSYFGYGIDDLANSQLSEEQRKNASELQPIANNQVADGKFYGSNLTIKSNIQFQFAFRGITDDMYATATFTGWKGNEETVNIPAGGFTKDGSVHIITLENMVVADARCMVTITVYNGDGTVYTKVQESIESYIARNIDKANVFAAFMKFADTAHKYLKNK